MYELLIKGGLVVDPAQKLHVHRDVGISGGKIVSILPDVPPSQAEEIIDAKGKIVTPGLIDLHAHVAVGMTEMGIPPDDAGVLSSVTAVCDAGSAGCENFADFRKSVTPGISTDLFSFLNICSKGLAIVPEAWNWEDINPDAILRTVDENRDIIKGIKFRAIGAAAEKLGVDVAKVAKRVAAEAKLPLMIHTGIHAGEKTPASEMYEFTRQVLSLLEKGDILCHIFTGKAGGVIAPDGTMPDELREAMGRGVVIDVAHGRGSLSFEIAKKGLEQGILPTTLSTDLTDVTLKDVIFSLPVTMSKFLALGLTLDQVITMTTINPAQVLGEESRRGTLRTGMPADVSILELKEGDFLFSDSKLGNKLRGRFLIEPRLTLKSGKVIVAQPSFDGDKYPKE